MATDLKLLINGEKKKNSIIELLRFLFALNVVKNHGYFPYQGTMFSPGGLSVEFFFILSGYLFVSTLKKYNDKSLLKDLFRMYKEKILGLGIPLFVGLGFNIASNTVMGWPEINIWGYMWYVHDMLMAFGAYLILRKIIKDDTAYWTIIVCVTVFTAMLHVYPPLAPWGFFRAFSSIGIGMILTKIPKLSQSKQHIAWIGFGVVFFAVLKIFIFGFSAAEEEFLILFLYPALIYFAFQIKCSCGVLNYLGALSFGLYAYQSIPCFMELFGYHNVWVEFGIILLCAVATDLLKRLMKFIRGQTSKRKEI